MSDVIFSSGLVSNSNEPNTINGETLHQRNLSDVPSSLERFSPSHEASSSLLITAVSDLMSAIEMLPENQKNSFLKAKRLCPQLVEIETPPSMFLKHDKFNYWKAAERLAAHWTQRESIFGERAFLPMTQTGNGALTKEDVVTLHTGSHAVLANAPTGQQVLFTDRRRILSSSKRECRARCFFYLTYMLARDDSARSVGILFLVLLVTPRPTTVDMTYMQQGLDVMEVMPATWHMHILNCISKTGKWSMARALIQAVVSSSVKSLPGLKVYTENSKGDILERLKGLGCVPEGLPPSVGGSWKYEEYTKWCRNRVMEELYFEEAHLPKTKIETNKGSMSDEVKKQRTKSLNVIHSRQKRERRKAEQTKLEQDCNRLQAERRRLQQESARLEALVAQALQLVQQIEANLAFPISSGIGNTFGPMSAPNAFPAMSDGAMTSQQALNNMQTSQMQAFLMNALAAQSMSQQPVGTQAQTTVGASGNLAIGNQQLQQSLNQERVDQRQTNQQPNNHSTQGLPMVQHLNQSNQSFPQNQIIPPVGSQTQQPPSQDLMQFLNQSNSLTPAQQQAFLCSISRLQSSKPAASSCEDTSNLYSNQSAMANYQVEPSPIMAPARHAPSPMGDLDLFASIDVHTGQLLPDTETPDPCKGSSVPAFAASSSSVPPEVPMSLRESVPKEFEDFEIPEPDPLRETPAGTPAYKQNFSFFGGFS